MFDYGGILALDQHTPNLNMRNLKSKIAYSEVILLNFVFLANIIESKTKPDNTSKKP